MWFYIFIAFLPSALIGILINDIIKSKLFNTFSVSFGLIIGELYFYL